MCAAICRRKFRGGGANPPCWYAAKRASAPTRHCAPQQPCKSQSLCTFVFVVVSCRSFTWCHCALQDLGSSGVCLSGRLTYCTHLCTLMLFLQNHLFPGCFPTVAVLNLPKPRSCLTVLLRTVCGLSSRNQQPHHCVCYWRPIFDCLHRRGTPLFFLFFPLQFPSCTPPHSAHAEYKMQSANTPG